MNTWILRLMPLILQAISGPLRKDIIRFAEEFREAARKTPNPWDDFLADILCWILQVP